MKKENITKGLKIRKETAKAMLPPGWMLVEDAAKNLEVTASVIYLWGRRGKVQIRIYNGIKAIKITKELQLKAKNIKEKRLRLKKNKTKINSEKYVNGKGEITNFWEWLKNIDAPLSYIVDS